MGLINRDKSSVSGVPPFYIRCALCVFCKKRTAKQNFRFCAFAWFRKQHELKRSHFDTECSLLADGSSK